MAGFSGTSHEGSAARAGPASATCLPYNNYGIAVNAGKYAHFTHYYQGEKGLLTMLKARQEYRLLETSLVAASTAVARAAGVTAPCYRPVGARSCGHGRSRTTD